MNFKNIRFLTIALLLAIHFFVKFMVSEPYPGLVLPSFAGHGGHTDFYQKAKLNFTFYSTDHDSLIVSPKVVFSELHPRFSNHYTSLLLNLKKNGKGLTEVEEKKLMAYLSKRGSTLWNFQKKVKHVILRKDLYTYIKNNPSIFVKKEMTQQWLIGLPQLN